MRLPTEAELVARHGVSRHTVRRAYQELVSERLVERVPGRGTFAAPAQPYARTFASVDDLLALADDTEMEVVRPLGLTAGAPKARADLDAGQVFEVTARRLFAGEPFAITVISLPVSIGRRLQRSFLGRKGARSSTTGLELIERRLGRRIADAIQEVTVDRAPAKLAGLIGLAEDEPALRIDRLYRDDGGLPVESTVNWFNPARYTYRVLLARAGR